MPLAFTQEDFLVLEFFESMWGTDTRVCPDSMNAGKSSQLGKHGFGSLQTLNENVIAVRTFSFDTDFASQMKLTNFPQFIASLKVMSALDCKISKDLQSLLAGGQESV